MALKLKLDSTTFWWPVNVTVPGQQAPEKIEIEFVYRTRKDYEAFQKEIMEAARTAPLSDAELIMRSAKNWRGVEGEFTLESVETFLDSYPAAGTDIGAAYHEALNGSRRGNLKR